MFFKLFLFLFLLQFQLLKLLPEHMGSVFLFGLGLLLDHGLLENEDVVDHSRFTHERDGRQRFCHQVGNHRHG